MHRRKLIALGAAVAAAGCLRGGETAPDSDDLLADAVLSALYYGVFVHQYVDGLLTFSHD